MKSLPSRLLTSLFLGLVVTTLPAQPTPVADQPPVRVEIKAISIGRGLTQAGVLQVGEKKPLYVPSFALSQPLFYEGPRDLVFVQTQLKDGVNKEVPVATATLPQDVAKVFILLTPSALSRGQFTTQVVPDLASGEGVTDARVVNLSPRPISLALNDDKRLIPAGESVAVPLIKGKLSVLIVRKNKQSEDESDICNETYSAPEGGRLTLLISNSSPTQSAENEAVSIISLVEEAVHVTPLKP